MSKERKALIKYLSEPRSPTAEDDVTDRVADLVQNREWRYLNALSLIYLRFRSAGKDRQAEIVQANTVNELDRLDPKSKWAVENGDRPPKKKLLNWGEF